MLSIANSLASLSASLLDIIRSGLKLSLPFISSQQLGEELIANGNFNDGGSAAVVDTDGDGTFESRSSTIPNWSINTNNNSDNPSVNLLVNGSGQLVISSAAAGSDAFGSAVQQLSTPLVANRLYQFKFDLISATPSSALTTADRVRIGTMLSSGAGSGVKNISRDATGNDLAFSTGTHVLYFTPTTNDTHISITGRYNVTELVVDNISLKEVGPRSLDETTNNNNAKLFTGTALNFDGTNDEVEVSNNAAFNFGTGDFTIVFWINKLLSGSGDQRVIDKRSSSKGYTVYLDTNNVLYLGLNDGTGETDFSLATIDKHRGSSADDAYQRIVISADRSGNATCYIDNVAQTPVDISAKNGDLDDTTNLFIGDAASGSSEFFSGKLSDVQLWNVAWSATDVDYDYTHPNELVATLPVANLKAWWAMTEGSGLIAFDSSGQGNNGTISGATYVTGQSSILQLGMINWAESLGSELVTNSSFDTDLSNWTIGNSDSTHTVTYSSGSARYQSDTTSPQLNFDQTISAVEIGKFYQVSINVTNTSGSVKLASIDPSLTALSEGSNVFNIKADSQTIRILRNSTNVDVLINSVSLKEIKFLPPSPTNPTQDVLGNSIRERLGSINFTGTGYVEVADDDDLDFGTGAFTMECWAKADYLNQNSPLNIIFSLGGQHTDTDSVFFSTNNSTTKIAARVGDNDLNADATYTIGRWYHLCVTRDGSADVIFYIDSVKQGSTQNTSNSVTNAHEKFIGRDATSTRFYKNLINGARLYNVALTADQVKQNYNAGTSAHTN